MATKNINKDLTATLVVDTSNDTYILEKKTTIETVDQLAIDLGGGANNINLILKGDVKAENSESVIRAAGGNIHIDVRLGAFVDGQAAEVGIVASGPSFSLANAGDIFAGVLGVSVEAYAEVVNTGRILGLQAALSADEGLQLTNTGLVTGDSFAVLADADGSVIRNLKGGRMIGETTGISLVNDGSALIDNAGLIKGQTAISDGGSDTTIINRGKIDGNVSLGGGDDIFNNRAGTLVGVVSGGEGGDTYIIGKSGTQIEESFDSGVDKVRSTISFTLGAHLEDLTLEGILKIKGTGNGDGNTITGNRGANVLSGQGGDDYLIGGKGNDVLIGGTDADLFDFRKGTGHDVVNDFVDGEDVIYTPFASNEADLLANHLIQKSGGVLVSYGNDSLFIKGATLAELDENDFFTI